MPAEESEDTGGLVTTPGAPAPSVMLGENAFGADSLVGAIEGQWANCGGATVVCGASAADGISGANGAACGIELTENGRLPMCSGIATGVDCIEGGLGGAASNAGTPSSLGFSL